MGSSAHFGEDQKDVDDDSNGDGHDGGGGGGDNEKDEREEKKEELGRGEEKRGRSDMVKGSKVDRDGKDGRDGRDGEGTHDADDADNSEDMFEGKCVALWRQFHLWSHSVLDLRRDHTQSKRTAAALQGRLNAMTTARGEAIRRTRTVSAALRRSQHEVAAVRARVGELDNFFGGLTHAITGVAVSHPGTTRGGGTGKRDLAHRPGSAAASVAYDSPGRSSPAPTSFPHRALVSGGGGSGGGVDGGDGVDGGVTPPSTGGQGSPRTSASMSMGSPTGPATNASNTTTTPSRRHSPPPRRAATADARVRGRGSDGGGGRRDSGGDGGGGGDGGDGGDGGNGGQSWMSPLNRRLAQKERVRAVVRQRKDRTLELLAQHRDGDTRGSAVERQNATDSYNPSIHAERSDLHTRGYCHTPPKARRPSPRQRRRQRSIKTQPRAATARPASPVNSSFGMVCSTSPISPSRPGSSMGTARPSSRAESRAGSRAESRTRNGAESRPESEGVGIRLASVAGGEKATQSELLVQQQLALTPNRGNVREMNLKRGGGRGEREVLTEGGEHGGRVGETT